MKANTAKIKIHEDKIEQHEIESYKQQSYKPAPCKKFRSLLFNHSGYLNNAWHNGNLENMIFEIGMQKNNSYSVLTRQ